MGSISLCQSLDFHLSLLLWRRIKGLLSLRFMLAITYKRGQTVEEMGAYPNSLFIDITTQLRIRQFLPNLRKISLHLLHTPWLRLSKLRQAKQRVTLHTFHQLDFVEFSSLFQHRALCPFSKWYLISLLVDVGETCGCDGGFEGVDYVEVPAGFGQGAREHRAPVCEKRVWLERSVVGVKAGEGVSY